MPLLGVQLFVLIGPMVPLPAPFWVAEALERVEVKESDRQRSGFQLTLHAGRSGPIDLVDYRLLYAPLLEPGNRVVLMVIFNGLPRVIMDGLIGHRELSPSNQPGESRLIITGFDISEAMDRTQRVAEHPGQDDTLIVTKLIAAYAQYGLIPKIIPPTNPDVPNPLERIPVQRGTDLQYIRLLAKRRGYVFHIQPGPLPGSSTAYFGPPIRLSVPQPAISVALGGVTNVESLNFRHDARRAVSVSADIQDPDLGVSLPVQTFVSTRVPPLSSRPALLVNARATREVLLPNADGLSYARAFSRAQAITDASADRVLEATGELDAVLYGGLLQARSLVGMRGAGLSHDGWYHVDEVTHILPAGSYKQRFTLSGEGAGSTTPWVRP